MNTRPLRIVYVGRALAGKLTSLTSSILRNRQPLSDPTKLLVGENAFSLVTRSGPLDVLLSVAGRRALHPVYDPVDPKDPVIGEEIDRLALADGLIFVIDSQTGWCSSNLESFDDLVRDLAVRGVDAKKKTIVFQANKRDMADIVTMDWVRANFWTECCAHVESIATRHEGTMEAMRELLRLTGSIGSGEAYRS